MAMRRPIKMFLYALLGLVSLVVLGVVAFLAYQAYDYHRYHNMPDTHDLKDRIDGMAGEYTAKREHVGVIVGVLQRGRKRVRGYGRGPDRTSPPDGKTIYEIGSITKVFTGIALARMELDGLVSLEDTLKQHLKDVPLHDQVAAITLKQLATHTSGLPPLPENFDALVKNDDDPYAYYRAEHLYEALATVKLENPPGKTPAYSNFGMGLLGHVLALRAGKSSYEDLIRDSICRPLGLRDTGVRFLGPEHEKRLLRGYSHEGKPTRNWQMDALAGAGVLRSTADDMLVFLEANLQAPEGPLGPALARAQEKHHDTWLDTHGLGWNIRTTGYGHTFHWHNGGTGGYVSFCGIDRENQNAVILISNYGDAFAGDDALDQMGFEILQLAAKISLE